MTPIGIMLYRHPKLTWRPQYKQEIREYLQGFLAEHPYLLENEQYMTEEQKKSTTVPEFEIFQRKFQASKFDDDNKKTTINSEVIQITTRRTDALWLKAALLRCTETTQKAIGLFVPYAWKQQEPSLVFDLIQAQNAFLHTTKAIPLCGIHPNIVNGICVRSHDESENEFSPIERASLVPSKKTPRISLILSINETSRSYEIGKYFALVHKDNEEEAYHFLDYDFPVMLQETDEYNDPANKFEKFPLPRRMTQNTFTPNNKMYSLYAQPLLDTMTPSKTNKLQRAPTQPRRISNPYVLKNRASLDSNHQTPQPPPNAWHAQGMKPITPSPTQVQHSTLAPASQTIQEVTNQLHSNMKKLVSQGIQEIKEATPAPSTTTTAASTTQDSTSISTITASVRENIQKDVTGFTNFQSSASQQLIALKREIALQKQENQNIRKLLEDHKTATAARLDEINNLYELILSQQKENHDENQKSHQATAESIKSINDSLQTISHSLQSLQDSTATTTTPARKRQNTASSPHTRKHPLPPTTTTRGKNYYSPLQEEAKTHTMDSEELASTNLPPAPDPDPPRPPSPKQATNTQLSNTDTAKTATTKGSQPTR